MTRPKTDPTLKWVLNELAAIKGERERIAKELCRLESRQAHLQAVERSLMLVLQTLTGEGQPSVESVPIVKAHRRYGERGQLRQFLRQALRDAYPRALDTCSLTDSVVQHFGHEFATEQQRKDFQDDSVLNALGRMAKAREIERLVHGLKGAGRATLWRWGTSPPTLEELHDAVPPSIVEREA